MKGLVMTSFWVAAIAMLVVAALIVIVPFGLMRVGKGASRSLLNQSLYRARRRELTAEDDQGLNDNTEALLQELQYNLLDDTDEQVKVTRLPSHRWMMLPALVLMIMLSLSLYLKLGAIEAVEDRYQAMEVLGALSGKVLDPSQSTSDVELRRFAQGLRARLDLESDESLGWLMLARTGQALRDLPMMLGAARRAYALDPHNRSIRNSYIQSLTFTGDEDLIREAEMLLKRALRVDPNDLDLWSVYAMMALEANQYELAIERWQRMLNLVPASSERAQILNSSIDYAKKQLMGDPQNPTESAPVSGTYRVQITLDPLVPLAAGTTLFVFAKAIHGSPVPIAARRLEHPSFPIDLTLSDQDNMLEAVKLSEQSTFSVVARLSIDGDPQTLEGDWQGVSQPVEHGDVKWIHVMIDSPL
jgi:cytochrome c-type biogenesis protein CcmH